MARVPLAAAAPAELVPCQHGDHVGRVVGVPRAPDLRGLYGTVGGLCASPWRSSDSCCSSGVLTERSRSIWPSVIAHGSWNAFVATSFSLDGEVENQVFTGSDALLGEFGWLAAVTMLALGIRQAAWHLRTPTSDGLSPARRWATARRCRRYVPHVTHTAGSVLSRIHRLTPTI
ncbi:MAG: CPBP family intramembrane metalloprotease [Microthrixaceae bacterium]|nr:CPBP family intramembrane metalloprotease [Microthrixaceae bacterium]